MGRPDLPRNRIKALWRVGSQDGNWRHRSNRSRRTWWPRHV